MDKTITTDLSPTCMTRTNPEPEEYDYLWCSEPRDAILIIVFTCTSVCGLVGNEVVLCFLGFRMKQNHFTVYVLNLAIADCSLLLILLPKFTLYFSAQIYCTYYKEYNLANAILFFMFLFCYLAGMYLLTAVSVERCLAALFPLWYRCHRPKHLSGILCGVLWALAALFPLLIILTCLFTESCDKVFIVLNTVHIALFSSIPLLSNLALFIKLRCGSQRRHPGKLYVAVLLSVLFLVCLGLPVSLEGFSYRYYREDSYMSFLLVALNSSINPVIYFLVGSCRQHRFECSLKLLSEDCLKRKPRTERGARCLRML